MKIRLALVGGFLGSGKTTLLLQSAHELERQGYKVALVMNDQGSDLVDTALARSRDIPVAEVVRGCFCCRFHDFLSAIQTVRDAVQPDIILAEPVGSCTDLVATVLRPLNQMYPDEFNLAAFTVLLDPNRDLTLFPAGVSDLYRWQLEEADILAFNKTDLFTEAEIHEQVQRLAQSYPAKQIVSLSAQTGTGVANWLERIMHQAPSFNNIVPIDYITYAEAEASLGWLNASGTLRHDQLFSLQAWAELILTRLLAQFQRNHMEIAHLKVHMRSGEGIVEGNLTGLGCGISWSEQCDKNVSEAQVIINARIESAPDALRVVVDQSMRRITTETGMMIDFHHIECFSPSPPKPTFRLA